MDVLSWDALTTQPASTNTLDGLSGVSLFVFAVMFIAVSALVLWPRILGIRRRIGRGLFGRWVSTGLWLSSLGLLFLILRFARIDPLTLSRPIWLVVILIGIACWAGWLMVRLITAPTPSAVPAVHLQRSNRPRKGGSYR